MSFLLGFKRRLNVRTQRVGEQREEKRSGAGGGGGCCAVAAGIGDPVPCLMVSSAEVIKLGLLLTVM